MATKIPKSGFTKAFTKTKLGFQLDKEIGKGDFIWQYDYKPKEGDDAWHPSSHCTPSPAELYHYALDSQAAPAQEDQPEDGPAPIQKNQAEGFTPGLYKIFQVGHFWHQYLQEVCLRAGFCEEEAIERRGAVGWGFLHKGSTPGPHARWEPFHWVTGSGDIAPCEIPGHGPYLVDFKTMGSHVFRGNTPSEETLLKWECQLNVYMDFFDLERALIVGINKDTGHDFKEFEFRRNEALIEALYYKWNLVSTCLDEGVEPPEDEEIDLPTEGPVNV